MAKRWSPVFTNTVSLGSFVLLHNRINMKAIALESKSNQARSHSDENELIMKATCLLKGREIKTERGMGNCDRLPPNVTSALLHPATKKKKKKRQRPKETQETDKVYCCCCYCYWQQSTTFRLKYCWLSSQSSFQLCRISLACNQKRHWEGSYDGRPLY